MVRSAVLAASLAFLVAGCANRYIITTTSGAKVITASKPKRVESLFTYRLASGGTNAISILRVRSIEPYSKAAFGKQPVLPEIQ